MRIYHHGYLASYCLYRDISSTNYTHFSKYKNRFNKSTNIDIFSLINNKQHVK